jgi:glutaryl-CoA dehydrogenase
MLDFYNIDSVLSEEERAVRDSVRRFVDERVLPIIGDAYVQGRFPKELIPAMGELGVFGANLPEEYGCAGLNNVQYGLIMQELERGDSGVRSFASVQGALAMYPIYAFGSEEQRQKYLPKMATGEIIGCFGEGAGRRLVDSQWLEDVDHQWVHGADLRRVGEDEWRSE